ncbi:MAG: hypothetical protein EOO60_09565 [Hymenobacter sp.]|nr:MAG: hypothetical protein EOO60_09565 [Hymenobacter sp.]
MRVPYLILSGFLASQPLISLAQGTNATPSYRFYGGLAAYSSSFQPLGGNSGHTTVPFQATVGYQLRPRWAVQLGAAYSGYNSPYLITEYIGSPGSSSYYSYDGAVYWRSLSVSLLGRYTLTHDLARRLQVDALGGFAFEHSSLRDTGLYLRHSGFDGVGATYSSQVSHNNLLAGLGASLRFRVVNHLEAVLDIVLNAPFASDTQPGIGSATALGLRYRFGQR